MLLRLKQNSEQRNTGKELVDRMNDDMWHMIGANTNLQGHQYRKKGKEGEAIQTARNLGSRYVPEIGENPILGKSQLSTHTVKYVVCSPTENSKPLEPDRPQHDRLTSCATALQYSATTFDSLRFHSCKEKFRANMKQGFQSQTLYFFCRVSVQILTPVRQQTPFCAWLLLSFQLFSWLFVFFVLI